MAVGHTNRAARAKPPTKANRSEEGTSPPRRSNVHALNTMAMAQQSTRAPR